MSSSATKRRERMRAMMSSGKCVNPASVYDPLSARCAEDLGYEVAMMAGSTAALAVLGSPDLVLLSLSEFAEQARRVCRAFSLPLLVDADHGYGNALHVARTVEDLEAAGVAAITIEDTLLPIGYGGAAAPMIPVDEGVGKIKAALAGRTDPATIIAARTSAVRLAGIDETVTRARAYESAGADALFLAGIKSAAELEAVASETSLPIMVGLVPAPMSDLSYLAAHRVRLALQGHKASMVSLRALYEAMSALRSGALPSELGNTADKALIARLTREPEYAAMVVSYLGRHLGEEI